MLSTTASLSSADRVSTPLAIDSLSRQILIGLFLLIYIPIFYYYGWVLPLSIGIDYPTYFHAARLAFVEGRSPYGPHAFDGIPGHMTEAVQPYLSLPPSLLVFWPLAELSPANARLLFVLVSQICYVGSILLILFRLTPLSRNGQLRDITLGFSLIYMLCFDPALSTLGTGEASFLILFLICLALSGFKNGSSPWRVALPLSVAILLKTYPAFLLLPLLFRKQYREIGLTGLFLTMFTGIAALVLPGNIWHSWLTDMLPLTGYINTRLPLAIPWNQSLNALVMRLFQENYFSKAPLFHPSLTKPVIVLLVFIIVGATSLCSFRIARTEHSESSKADEISAYLLLTFLIAPLAWDHHLIYILPAATVVISLLLSGSISRTATTVMVVALFLMAWKLPLGSFDKTQSWETLFISIKLYAVVVLWLFFINRLLRQSRAPVTTTVSPITA